MPGSPVGVTVKAEGVGSGQAELSEALFALDVVGVRRNQQTTRLQLDAVARAESKSGPFFKNRGGSDTQMLLYQNFVTCSDDTHERY